MNNSRINISFEFFTMQRMLISSLIKKCVLKTLEEESVVVPCEINVLVTDDATIRSINRESRNIDKATDVLSFPMFTFKPGELPMDWTDYMDPDTNLCALGDIAISLERAAEQAVEFGHSLRREVGYLTIHSMLHLLGYDHLDEAEQKAQMRQREEHIANIIGLKR
jgi:probable rRNA maturation factor